MLKISKSLKIIFFELQQNSFYKVHPIHFIQIFNHINIFILNKQNKTNKKECDLT